MCSWRWQGPGVVWLFIITIAAVSFPNPEEGKGAWQLAFQAAESAGARLAIANDPDADRFAVAEQDAATGEQGCIHEEQFNGCDLASKQQLLQRRSQRCVCTLQSMPLAGLQARGALSPAMR